MWGLDQEIVKELCLKSQYTREPNTQFESEQVGRGLNSTSDIESFFFLAPEVVLSLQTNGL